MSGLYKLLKPDFEFRDERGKLVQLVHAGYEQVNVLESYAGTLRGGHYHKESREVFYVADGSVDVSFIRGEEREDRTFHSGEFFLIYPEVVHSMSFPEDCTLIAMYDKCVERADGKKDIHPG